MRVAQTYSSLVPTLNFSQLSKIFCCAISLMVVATTAHAAPIDFDRDGKSDLVTIETLNDVNDWTLLQSSDATVVELGEFGTSTDLLFVSSWKDSLPLRSRIEVSSDGNSLRWVAEGADQVEQEFLLGENGDTLLAGADFDGDGLLDAAATRLNGTRLEWSVLSKPFESSAAQESSFFFGGKRERPFYFVQEGTQVDSIATLRRVGRGRFTIRMKNMQSGVVRRLRGFGQFAAANPNPQLFPIKQQEGHDIVLSARSLSSSTQISILNYAAATSREVQLDAVGSMVVGEFLPGQPGEELAIQDDDAVVVFNPRSEFTRRIEAVSPRLVDEVVNGEYRSEYVPPQSPDPAPIPGDPVGGGEGGLDQVCASRSAIAMGELLIKSEISKHIHSGDRRATGYTLVCARQCPKNLQRSDFYYANGTYAGSVGYYGRFSGNGKPRLYGAAGQAPQHFAASIAAKARTIGNGKLYMQMSAARSGAATSCKEFNASGRNGGL